VVTISKIRRPDFTNALVHLTRERKEYKQADEADEFSPQELVRTVSAFDVLKEILASGVIRGSGK
jgi:hypothetical protein